MPRIWPDPHLSVLGQSLLEKLYSHIPARVMITVAEAVELMRCSRHHIHHLIEDAALDAVDTRRPGAAYASYLIYRYSVVSWLFEREFVSGATRAGLAPSDLDRCVALADRLRAAAPRNPAACMRPIQETADENRSFAR